MINSGIYKITNLINNKIYVGSAIDLKKRKREHFTILSKNIHHSILLQNSFNKHGLENFSFEVIEYIEDKTKLIEREQHYIDTLKPHYNICQIAGSCLGIKRSPETKLKLSLAGKNKIFTKEHRVNISKAKSGKPNKNIENLINYHTGRKRGDNYLNKIRKKIIQLDIQGNFIGEWDSIKEAQESLKIGNISSCCNGKRKSSCGFKFEYK